MELLLFKFLPLSGVSDKDTGLVAAVDRQAPLQATFTLDLFMWCSTGIEISSSRRRIQVQLRSPALNL